MAAVVEATDAVQLVHRDSRSAEQHTQQGEARSHPWEKDARLQGVFESLLGASVVWNSLRVRAEARLTRALTLARNQDRRK